MRGLLEHAQADPQVGERYEYGAHHLFANHRPARDREMASIDSRGFRAAELLDPEGDFDTELTALLP